MPELLGGAWWALLIVGLLAGILSAALGVGSGILIVPALVILLAVPQKSAQGTALAVMVPMALLGAYLYWRDAAIHISLPVAGLLAAGALVGVFVGKSIVSHVPAIWLRRGFAVFMIIVAVRMFTLNPERRTLSAPTTGSQTAAQEEPESND